MRQFLSLLMVEMLVGGLLLQPVTAQAQNAPAFGTTTPIQHLVVIFQENVSFDHYFGTYPNAMNPQGQPKFTPVAGTPDVNGLTGAMVTNNPNVNAANGAGSTNPFRLDRSQAATSDQNHNYTPEITALHGGLVDLYPSSVGVAGTVTNNLTPGIFGTTGINLGYYDGNTVTALWNYAQHYAMSDNSYDTNFGPSTPGAINLVSGQTNGAVGNINGTASVVTSNPDGSTTIIGDADPLGDVCSTTTAELYSLTGQTIGDLLNAKGITWGFYTQGFDLGVTNANGTTGCKRSTTSLITNTNKADYIPHHEPFQYYKSTQNLTHARPTSVTSVGSTDAANHQYDVHDFYDAINSGNFPAVNFLKAPGYQDGHAGYSDPLDEQTFIVNVINFLQGTSYWNNTAVVIMYDDSDGWYDHQMPPIMNQSNSSADNGACGTGTNALPGPNGVAHAQGRCGYGPRLPMLVISPYSKANFVDHTVTDQTSVIRFVEDNWLNGQRIGNGSFDTIANSIANMFDFTKMQAKGKLVLDPTTGLVTNGAKAAK